MPIDPGELYTGQITYDEIREYWVGDRSPRVDSFTYRTANCHETFWIPASTDFADRGGGTTDSLIKLRAFIQTALGVDYVSVAGSTYSLKRQIPLFHPIHTSLYCDAIISVNGVGPRGDDPNQWSAIETVTPAKWDKYEVVCNFGIPKWRMRGDSQVSRESQRYVEFRLNPDVQMVSVDKGNVILDGPGTSAHNKPTLQAAARRETTGVILTWRRVPAEWVYNIDSGSEYWFELPDKLLMAQGNVNKTTFFGQAPETLQLMKVDLGEPYVMPLLTDIKGDIDAIHNPYFAHDITFYFTRYDPLPKGKPLAADKRKDYQGRRGWNFFLFSDLSYYYGTVQSTGRKIFNTCNFDKLFTHWTDAFVVNADGSLD